MTQDGKVADAQVIATTFGVAAIPQFQQILAGHIKRMTESAIGTHFIVVADGKLMTIGIQQPNERVHFRCQRLGQDFKGNALSFVDTEPIEVA